jgi:hypothetical protein
MSADATGFTRRGAVPTVEGLHSKKPEQQERRSGRKPSS